MYRCFSLTLAFLFFLSPIQALLPPLYEGIKELQALLAAPELGKKLPSGDVIEKIERTDKGFKIITNKRELEVEVLYNDTGRIGPASFTLNFGEPVKISEN